MRRRPATYVEGLKTFFTRGLFEARLEGRGKREEARMIGRILVGLTAFALAGFLLLVLIGLWDGYEQETKALGFSGIYEHYLASQAGFADDAKGYRAVVEAESARTAVVAETAAIEE